MNKLVIVGHICHDLPSREGEVSRLGGASSFAAAVAGMHGGGLDVTVVTRAPESHPRIEDLNKLSVLYGFNVVNLALGDDHITTFVNEYDAFGNRTQHHPDAALGYTARDARIIGGLLEGNGDSALLIGTVARNEIDFGFLETIGNVRQSLGTNVMLLPQGLVRYTHPDTKRVTHDAASIPWMMNPGLLDHAVSTLMLSEEDLLGMPQGYEEFLASHCPNLIVTRGERGGSIYQNGQRSDQPAFQLTDNEIRYGVWTGSGDTVATTTLTGMLDGKTIHTSFAEAQLHVAAKICAGLRGSSDGIPSIPTPGAFDRFIIDRQSRVDTYVKSMHDLGIALDIKGVSTNSKERK